MNNRLMRLLLALPLALLIGCSSAPVEETESEQAELAPAELSNEVVADQLASAQEGALKEVAPSNVRFLDIPGFDGKLSKSLGSGHDEVIVDFIVPAHINELPERLENWLARVEASGGAIDTEVELQEGEPAPRFVGAVLSLGKEAYDYAKIERTYSPADTYDAVIRFKPDGQVQHVVFVRRSN